ncbi:Uncharacterised protein [Serratia liquefaciens]|nr:Uncharacterised protein [Serratia liquefaciens]
MATKVRPYQSALYSSWRANSPQLASVMCLDSLGLRIMFFTFKDSTQTTWFSLISLRDNLCKLSMRQSAIFAWSFATLNFALARLLEPFFFLLKRRCSSAKRFAYFSVWRGLPVLFPVSVTNKSFKPTSMPTVFTEIGSGFDSNTHKQDTKYRPDASLEIVILEGVEGRTRLQRTSNGSLLLAMYSLPSRCLKAVFINVADCR